MLEECLLVLHCMKLLSRFNLEYLDFAWCFQYFRLIASLAICRHSRSRIPTESAQRTAASQPEFFDSIERRHPFRSGYVRLAYPLGGDWGQTLRPRRATNPIRIGRSWSYGGPGNESYSVNASYRRAWWSSQATNSILGTERGTSILISWSLSRRR